MVQQHLGCSGHSQYAFHWSTELIPPRLLLYRQNQQDALRHSWDGLRLVTVAGTDGSVDERTEQMGAAYVLGMDPDAEIIHFNAARRIIDELRQLEWAGNITQLKVPFGSSTQSV